MIALYARISKKDKRVQKVSNTIENQLFLLRSYVSDNAICGEQEDIHEFTDDGYSGTDRKRPSFMKVLAWVELEKIDTVIVKDFSRLSRDHLLISELREKYFPLKQIRFIAVLDGYDSLSDENTGIIYPFKTLFNEFYCSDISRKVRCSLEAKKSSGEYAVAKLPFGYEIKDSKVVCRKDKAELIRNIYKRRKEGSTYEEISKLYDMTVSQVWRILHEPAYLGFHVWHRYEIESLPLKRRVKQMPEQWKMVSDDKNDIAVIDESMLSDDIVRYYGKSHRKNNARHIFHGITKCGICGNALCSDRAKKGWLCCRKCNGKEKKLIMTGRLYQLFFDRLKVVFYGEVCCCDREKKTAGQRGNREIEFFEKLSQNIKTDVDREMLLNIFVRRIYVSEPEKVIIYWRIKK